MSDSERTTRLLIICFSGLDPRLKLQFDSFITNGRIDTVLHRMITQGLFPEWFCDELTFDPLYGRINGLRHKLAIASADLLIRIDGTTLQYHLENLEPEEISRLRESIDLDAEYVASLTHHMNERLLDTAA
jgi:hypothetical protein